MTLRTSRGYIGCLMALWLSLAASKPARAADLVGLLNEPVHSHAALLSMAFVGGRAERVEALLDDPRLGVHACAVLVRMDAAAATTRQLQAGRRCIFAEAWRSVPAPTGLPLLAAYLKDPDPEVRSAAFQGMLGYGPESAPFVDQLVARAPRSGEALAKLGLEVIGPLADTHEGAAAAVGHVRDPAGVAYVSRCPRSVRLACVRALEHIAAPSSRSAVLRYARDRDALVRWSALETLLAMGPSARDGRWVVKRVRHGLGNEASAAIRVLQQVGTESELRWLLRELGRGEGPLAHIEAIQGIGALGSAAVSARPQLEVFWNTGNAFERVAALESLGRVAGDDPAVLERLQAALGSADEPMQGAARRGLEHAPGDRAAPTARLIHQAAAFPEASTERARLCSAAATDPDLAVVRGLLASDDLKLVMAAARVAVELGLPEAADVLVPLAGHEAPWVRVEVVEGLASLGLHSEVLVERLGADDDIRRGVVTYQLARNFPDVLISVAREHPDDHGSLRALENLENPSDEAVELVLSRVGDAEVAWDIVQVMERWLGLR